MNKNRQDIAASVHQRLLNRARGCKRSFNELLQLYAMERFLYRLSLSPYCENFVLKDFFDIWLLSRRFEFRLTDLCNAVQSICTRRSTVMGSEPEILSQSFTEIDRKQRQWHAFLQKSDIDGAPVDFKDVAVEIKAFLDPVIEFMLGQDQVNLLWKPTGPWE